MKRQQDSQQTAQSDEHLTRPNNPQPRPGVSRVSGQLRVRARIEESDELQLRSVKSFRVSVSECVSEHGLAIHGGYSSNIGPVDQIIRCLKGDLFQGGMNLKLKLATAWRLKSTPAADACEHRSRNDEPRLKILERPVENIQIYRIDSGQSAALAVL